MIYHYEYRRGGEAAALGALYELTESGAESIVCRIRRSSDNVLFVHQDTVLSERCFCDEYVADLRFREIDALMKLCGYHVLTLDRLLEGYKGDTPLILHFRSLRPNAGIISRIVADSRFSFATDSAEQLAVIAEGFPQNRTVGFACHLPVAEKMAESGASAVCMYGRDVQGFQKMDFSHVKAMCPLWYEFVRTPEDGLDNALNCAASIGFEKVVMSLAYLR